MVQKGTKIIPDCGQYMSILKGNAIIKRPQSLYKIKECCLQAQRATEIFHTLPLTSTTYHQHVPCRQLSYCTDGANDGKREHVEHACYGLWLPSAELGDKRGIQTYLSKIGGVVSSHQKFAIIKTYSPKWNSHIYFPTSTRRGGLCFVESM